MADRPETTGPRPDYDEGFVAGWEHAMAVLEWFGMPRPQETALMKAKRGVLLPPLRVPPAPPPTPSQRTRRHD